MSSVIVLVFVQFIFPKVSFAVAFMSYVPSSNPVKFVNSGFIVELFVLIIPLSLYRFIVIVSSPLKVSFAVMFVHIEFELYVPVLNEFVSYIMYGVFESTPKYTVSVSLKFP